MTSAFILVLGLSAGRLVFAMVLCVFNYYYSPYITISHGSVATHFRWGGIFNDRFVENFLFTALVN